MKTTKSPKKTARVAYAAAKEALPAYSHKFSPQKFTQAQLVGCLESSKGVRNLYILIQKGS